MGMQKKEIFWRNMRLNQKEAKPKQGIIDSPFPFTKLA